MKRDFGFFVDLDNYDEKEYVIKGRRHGKRFRLGDNVGVRVAKINAFRSESNFELVQIDQPRPRQLAAVKLADGQVHAPVNDLELEPFGEISKFRSHP